MLFKNFGEQYNGEFFIWGAGGLGFEILGWMIAEGLDLGLFKGFIADTDNIVDERLKYPVFNDVYELGSINVLVCIGSATGRRSVALKLGGSQAEILGYCHSSAIFGYPIRVGRGCLIGPRTSIASDVALGDFCLINGGSGVGHGTTLSAYSTLFGACVVNGDCAVGEGVEIGAGAIVHPGIRIGNYARVGIGSVVLRNVLANRTVFGNPAVLI